MNITRFEYLLSLETIGSVTGVAEQFFISPSAVSQCLKNEEAELGYRLFKNQNRRMVPTEAGIIYLKGARKILQIRDTTMEKLNVIPKSHHSVRIAIDPMLYEDMSAVILPRLNASLPDTRFELLRADSRVSVAYLLNNLADFALLCSSPLKHTALSEEILGEDQLLLLVPKAYLRGQLTGEPTIADCDPVPFILLKNGTNTRNIENEILSEHHISLSRIYEVDDHFMARKFLEEGRGATFLPASMIPDQAEKQFYVLTPEPARKFNFLLVSPRYPQAGKEKRLVPVIIRKSWLKTDIYKKSNIESK